MESSNRRPLLFLILIGLAASVANGQEEAQRARKPVATKKSSRLAKGRREYAAPPVCPNHSQERTAGNVPQAGAEAFPGAGVMDRMMRNVQQNPANGFRDFLSEQEAIALREVSLTIDEERRIGRRFRDEYLAQAKARGFRLSNDEKKLAYLSALVEGLAPRMRNRARYPKIEVSLINAPIADGQSCPGGFLIFTTALLDAPDEATVAGVVAHELAHLDLGHLNEYARRDKLAATAFQPVGNTGGPVEFSRFFERGMAAGSVFMNPFKPHHELEADCQAVTWLYQSGYDPRAMARFFEDLHDRQRDQPANPFFEFNRSHPYTLQRRDEVLSRIRQLRSWSNRADLGLFEDNLRKLDPRQAP